MNRLFRSMFRVKREPLVAGRDNFERSDNWRSRRVDKNISRIERSENEENKSEKSEEKSRKEKEEVK